MTFRLSEAVLDRLPAGIVPCGYDRSRLEVGIVHLGLGAFHRAHQTPVYDAVARAGDRRWGVAGVAMRTSTTVDRLKPQQGLFTLGIGEQDQLTGCLKELLVAPQAQAAVVAAMVRPTVHLITTTITEKGYAAGPDGPGQAARLIAAAAEGRRLTGGGGFTVLCCDNLPGAGRRLREQAVAAADTATGDWLAGQVTFPDGMVDRITPATTEEDITAFASRTGIEDQGRVRTEPFWQWVVEDRFAGPRPAFEVAGVQIVRDVAPWEAAKLRLLNAAHSKLAWWGLTRGLRYVHEAIAAPEATALLGALWGEARQTLPAAAGLDLDAYLGSLRRRLADPAMAHRLDQIVVDSSQKVGPRLLQPLVERSRTGARSPALAGAVAEWIAWLEVWTRSGRQIEDPLATELVVAAGVSGEGEERVSRILAVLGLAENSTGQLAREIARRSDAGADRPALRP
mgnify:CR=1 FL=1